MDKVESGRKTVLITGASAGIGRETAYVFAEHNYDLVLAARRQERLEEIKRDIETRHGVSVSIFPVDLSRLDSAAALHAETIAKGLSIDILINNAGFGTSGKFTEIDIDRETEMLMLNTVTLTRLTKLFARDMASRKRGHIVNIASTASFQPIPGFACYAATKAYVLSFSEALEFELRADRVKVTAICPGATESEFATTAGMEKAGMFDKAPNSRQLGEFIYKSTIGARRVAIHGLKNAIMVRAGKLMPRNFVMAVAAKLTR
ncbi:MAG TPA: SDR family oxidoreductase [Rectinemataceae bacterium]|nr:SDR family oxidoreductase [Rectinemataceae bacterium]